MYESWKSVKPQTSLHLRDLKLVMDMTFLVFIYTYIHTNTHICIHTNNHTYTCVHVVCYPKMDFSGVITSSVFEKVLHQQSHSATCEGGWEKPLWELESVYVREKKDIGLRRLSAMLLLSGYLSIWYAADGAVTCDKTADCRMSWELLRRAVVDCTC